MGDDDNCAPINEDDKGSINVVEGMVVNLLGMLLSQLLVVSTGAS